MSLSEYRKYGITARRMAEAIKSGNLSHAYIFEGDATLDKAGFSKALAKAILCKEAPGEGCDSCSTCLRIEHDNYEDIYHILPTVKKGSNRASVKDEDMETLQEQLKLRPTGGDRNIAIIEGGDTMTPKAQNRFLKTLEEPAEGTVVIILSENTENLLPTINSRCIRYRLMSTEETKDEGLNPLADEFLDMVFRKDLFSDVTKVLDKEIKDRETAMVFLDAVENALSYRLKKGDRKASRNKLIYGVECTEKARREIMRNVSFKYAIRELILKLEDYKW